jgi:hypothetical protein
LFGPDPSRIAFNPEEKHMLKKLLVALIASAFALGAYAQAPKSDDTKAPATKGEAKAETKAETKTDDEKKKAKKAKKAKAKKAKGDEAKVSGKDVTKKEEAKKETK